MFLSFAGLLSKDDKALNKQLRLIIGSWLFLFLIYNVVSLVSLPINDVWGQVLDGFVFTYKNLSTLSSCKCFGWSFTLKMSTAQYKITL